MTIKESALQSHGPVFSDDLEIWQRISNFAFDEVVSGTNLDQRMRLLSNLAYLLGCQGIDEFKLMLPVVLENGLSAIEVKEVVYQAVDYLGLGRVLPFYQAVNDELKQRNISLPLKDQATTTQEKADRLEKGEETQMRLFGPQMKNFAFKGTINEWLVDNCFGDYYTRTGLSDQDREMITFCYLAAQGGVEPQLLAHAKANLRLGNSAEFLKNVVLANVPFIGYPRSLNALNVIEQATQA